MQAERKSIVTVSSAPSMERSDWLRNTLIELGKLALSRQLSMTPECLLLMAQDLIDEQMDRFPTVRQLRVQAKLIAMEGRR
jgi:hypothetical protein